jgi:mRNA degradation ribonuclease J1/J2
VTTSPDEIIQARQLDDKGVVVLLVEGTLVEVLAHEGTSERESRLFLQKQGRQFGTSDDPE